jgi:uncharacterized Zn finger protein
MKNQPQQPATPVDPFADLTWDDLEAWVGGRYLERGRAYQREHAVSALARPQPGILLGRVAGGELYRTRVESAEGDAWPRVTSDCSCPLGGDCKHAVAVVLEYLDRLREGQTVATELPAEAAFDPDEDEWDEAVTEEASESPAGRVPEDAIVAHLQGLSQNELVSLVCELAAADERTAELLGLRATLHAGEVSQLVRSARKLLQQISAQRGWSDHWSDGGFTPDYTPFRDHLNALLAADQPDLVVELGGELLEKSRAQIDESNDENETMSAVTDCLDVVSSALGRCSLSPAERLLWVLDRQLADDYDLCAGLGEAVVEQAEAAAWSEVADTLLARLESQGLTPAEVGGHFHVRYRRDDLADCLFHALRRADRGEEVIVLAVREASINGSYRRAVDLLLEAGREEEGATLAREGISRLDRGEPGTASGLRQRLRDIAARRGDTLLVAAFYAEEFLADPHLQGYQALHEGAQAAGVWPELREHLLEALVTGDLAIPAKNWPLPATGLPASPPPHGPQGPRCALLTEIALDEGDHAAALAHYRQATQQTAWLPGDLAARVARGIAPTYPDEAAALWQALASRAIAGGNRRAYESSLQYRRPLRRLLLDAGRGEEWEAYLAELRGEHRRRPALLDTLSRLDDHPLAQRP